MSALNLPNMLSISRVFLVPIVMVFLTQRGQFGFIEGVNVGDMLAGFVFIIASLTDAADGYIARKRGIVTNLGKFIDPLADKIMVVAVLVALVDIQRVPAWMVVVIISREFIVTGLRMIAAYEGIVIAASKGGKLKTVSQIIGIISTEIQNIAKSDINLNPPNTFTIYISKTKYNKNRLKIQ